MPHHQCSETMRNFLQELPKCEHHVHLEGTLEPELLFELAKRNNIVLPEQFPKSKAELTERYNNFADLQDFLDFYYIGTSVLLTEDDFFQLAWNYFERVAKNDGLAHTEVFFDPQSHTERGVSMDTVVKGFKRGCEKAEEELGISTKLIMCLLRHLPSSHGLETINQAEEYIVNGHIHALGLDSAEKPFPPELFVECYEKVKQLHGSINLTAHAGEEGDHTYITNSLDLLNVKRIDHGVNSIQSVELLQRLSDERILLSVCPLSNIKLQVFKELTQIPLLKFLEHDVPFSLNSDDPAYFGGYILDNYIAIHENFGFKIEIWEKIVKNSIHGSWCHQSRKDELLEKLQKVIEKYSVLLE
ncbi:hypothetical protein WICMUC_003697 [Wickerhamomyces mucosus]|uniref:Adenine deaminase n=1 Tax=Wickerhamomyces mucosus TaxID=1378264 RepID=A0A9P8PJD3_9ASCO|nr:hypothetical protein WICMUC_003697 [Wickerhamomyces mucosus]